jgi:uncharacterized protein YndB with AHSA1/START domain
MPYTFQRSVIIGAPPEQVYDYLLDIPAHMQWGDMDELELLYEGPVQVGSRWRSTGVTSNIRMQDECTVTAMERPYLFSFRVRSQTPMYAGVITISYRLERLPQGTRVTFSREYDRSELPAVMRALAAVPGFEAVVFGMMDRLITSRAVDRGLFNLRDRLESSPATQV